MSNSQRVAAALAAATDTVALEIGIGILDRLPHIFAEAFPNKKALVVADDNTWRAAGRAAYEYLTTAGITCDEPYIFSADGLHAEWHYIDMLDARLAATDAIAVAVGSGTINDLCKLSSYHTTANTCVWPRPPRSTVTRHTEPR